MSKISNVLTMIEYLSTGKKYSINELSQLLEVTPRMIRVYKNEIEKVPSNIIANIFKFKPELFFEIDKEEKENQKISFK